MTFTLKPDDNGVTVTLMNVNEEDEAELKKADKDGFDPTEAPFNKYYAYDKQIGFYVSKDFFDHADHKGKRLSFDEYMSLMRPDKPVVTDSQFDLGFVVKRILEIKEPKDVQSANAALATLNFALFKLLDNADEATDEQKADFHKAIDHAFAVFAKADEILSGSNYAALIDLSNQLKKNRDLTSQAQAKLLQKYNENF